MMNAWQLLDYVIIPLVADANRTIPGFKIENPTSESKVFGASGAPLDSFALVGFVFALERAVQEKLGLSIRITVEDVLRQEKNPFDSLRSIAEFISQKTGG